MTDGKLAADVIVAAYALTDHRQCRVTIEYEDGCKAIIETGKNLKIEDPSISPEDTARFESKKQEDIERWAAEHGGVVKLKVEENNNA